MLLRALGLAAVLGFAATANAAEPAGWSYELANELMSPWHAGEPLAECSNPNALELRLWLLEQEKLGRSQSDVEAELMAKYGERIRQAPKAEGRGLVAYLLPAALGLAGAAIAFGFLRRVRAAPAAPGAADAPPSAEDPALARRLDEELAAFDATHADS